MEEGGSMILFLRRHQREMEAALVPEPTPHLLVENERVYEPDDLGLLQFTTVEATEFERAARADADFQIGHPEDGSSQGKPIVPRLWPRTPPTDDDPF
jgi:hypothetical protein